jgi:hypothetical protein
MRAGLAEARRRFRWLSGLLLPAVLLVLALPPQPGGGAEPEGPAAGEGKAVLQAARAYLEAEVRRDLAGVWASLAPSSVYCETHDFQAYREEADRSPVRIERFEILRVTDIRPNHDPARFPKVERFADVEVDLVLLFVDTGTREEVNYRFTFLREGGRWYKG